MSAPAIASHYLSKHPSAALENTRLAFLQSPRVADVLKWLAAGEMVGDKVPGAPDRITAPSLLARGLSGALVGAALFKVS